MAYDGWLEFNGVELVNLARTVALSEAMGIDAVWVPRASVDWIPTALGQSGYEHIFNAPWYSALIPESSEFAGVVPLGFPGLDDSTVSASTVEYVTDGGRSGKPRNTTLSIVGSVALVGLTDRGVEFGKAWLDQTLRNVGAQTFCSGADLRYFRSANAAAPIMHRRNVRLTRGSSVTRKRHTDCSSVWLATFTLSADDPFEYGEPQPVLADLGAAVPTGSLYDGILGSYGTLPLVQQSCPAYDYSPIYDPVHPALVPAPEPPNFYPAGWGIEDGMTFTRHWARLVQVTSLMRGAVPFLKVTSNSEARRVRISLWDGGAATDLQCDPLFSVILSYVPASTSFYVDGEQQASYVWNGSSPEVRRTDSLVYGPDATPVDWVTLFQQGGLLVTLDIFTDGGLEEGGGDIRVELSMISKST